MQNTKIEWAHHTFNPWIGCTHVSEGCRNCYAETQMDHRYGRVQWGKGKPRVRTSEANWKLPFKWNRAAEKAGVRHRVFCASLADVFDEEVNEQWRLDLFALIILTPHLDWLLLTKRAEKMQQFMTGWADALGLPLENVWLGVSVEDQQRADERIPLLLECPAVVRFLSAEPLLGPVDLSDWIDGCDKCGGAGQTFACLSPCGDPVDGMPVEFAEEQERTDGVVIDCPWCVDGGALHWVIVGGESGPGARPMHPEWARSVRDKCNAASVPFLFKQWGEWRPAGQGDYATPRGPAHIWPDDDAAEVSFLVGKKAARRLLDGREHNEFPQVD